MSIWKKLEDELPPVRDRVLVQINRGTGKFMTVAYRTFINRKAPVWRTGGGQLSEDSIIAWCPIPPVDV